MNKRSMLLRVLVPSVFVLALGAEGEAACVRSSEMPTTASLDAPVKVQTSQVDAVRDVNPGV